jgi:hypothetical protein
VATLKSRLLALEHGRDDWEILNPRTFDDPPEMREELERQNTARVAAAVKAGHRIIRLQPMHNFGD